MRTRDCRPHPRPFPGKVPWVPCAALLVLGDPAAAGDVQLHGFADFNLVASREKGKMRSDIALGQLDFYVAGRVSNSIGFLVENVVEFDEEKGEFIVDLERLQATYRHRDHLVLGAGKVHNPLGYWNTAFHHGKVLQVSAERPKVFRFEDDGGYLPIHATAVFVEGRHIGSWDLGYDLLAGNSRDANSGKTYTARVIVRPRRQWMLGASAGVDELTARMAQVGDGLDAPGRDGATEVIWNGIAGVEGHGLEVLAEYFAIQHRDTRTHTTHAGYVFGSYTRGAWTPYARYDFAAAAATDPYLVVPDADDLVLGLRREVSALSYAKAEFRLLHGSRNGVVSTAQEFVAQYSFGF